MQNEDARLTAEDFIHYGFEVIEDDSETISAIRNWTGRKEYGGSGEKVDYSKRYGRLNMALWNGTSPMMLINKMKIVSRDELEFVFDRCQLKMENHWKF